MHPAQLLVVDDDPIVLDSLKELLSLEGYSVSTADSLSGARGELKQRQFHTVLLDVRLPDGNGLELVEEIGATSAAVIMMTAYGTIEDAVQAVKIGAHNYLTKPLKDEEILLNIERGLEHRSLLNENALLREQLEQNLHLENFVCQDPAMRRALEQVRIVASTDTTVLITGESGTGKTVTVRALHENSKRADKPFVEVNCGSLPETLLESELFGHVKGAFTGAVENRRGKFEVAEGGTIFLDEISNASPSLQMKLLRVLESFEFEPVGSTKTISLDVRVVLATNQELSELVNQGRFREDLYYRVNVFNIHLPPLRERRSEIPLLAHHFLEKYRSQNARELHGFTPEAMRVLTEFDWPGNVRELENVVQRAVVLAQGAFITLTDLPVEVVGEQVMPEPEEGKEILPLKKALGRWERQIIIEALRANNGLRKETAKGLGINRTTLYNKMREFGLLDM